MKTELTGRFSIAVAEVELDAGGRTIWVQSQKGATVLRIKCTGKIIVRDGCDNLVSHSDMIVQGDIEVCVVAEDCARFEACV